MWGVWAEFAIYKPRAIDQRTSGVGWGEVGVYRSGWSRNKLSRIIATVYGYLQDESRYHETQYSNMKVTLGLSLMKVRSMKTIIF